MKPHRTAETRRMAGQLAGRAANWPVWSATWCLALAMACSGTFGQELGSLEWFKKEWKAASKWTVPDFTLFEFQGTGHRYVTQEEVRALAALVEGKPEHPKRYEYKRKLSGLKVPNASERTRLWFGADGFRESADPKYPGGLQLDQVIRKNVRWALRRNQLGIFDPRLEMEGQEYASSRASASRRPRRFVLGGMGGSEIIEHRIISSRVDEAGKWVGRTESTDGTLAIEWAGTIDTEHNVIFVDSSTVTKAEGREFLLNTHWEYSDWAYSDYFKKPIAHKVVRFDRQGRPVTTFDLIGFSKITSKEFNVLTRIPSHDVPDVIRGDTPSITIADTRPGVQEVRRVLPDGSLAVRSLAPQNKKSTWRGRIIGILVASIAIGGIWVVYCRRR